jgi:hypothetical protein
LRETRILIVLGMLALFAFATMAPHFRTWDIVRSNAASFDTEIVALSLTSTPNGTALHGDAEITLKIGDSLRDEGRVQLSFDAKCISPLCGGFELDQVEMHGKIKFVEGTWGEGVMGEGILSGPIKITLDPTGQYIFSGDGLKVRARMFTLAEPRR